MFECNWALFVCTGNFYRSRFAEAVFNHEAGHAGLGWRAFSRGLRPHLHEGDLSPHTAAALRQRGICVSETAGPPSPLKGEDFVQSTLVVALDQEEHRAPLENQFGIWAEQVEFWNFADIPEGDPAVVLPGIERKVKGIVRALEYGSLVESSYPAFVSEF